MSETLTNPLTGETFETEEELMKSLTKTMKEVKEQAQTYG